MCTQLLKLAVLAIINAMSGTTGKRIVEGTAVVAHAPRSPAPMRLCSMSHVCRDRRSGFVSIQSRSCTNGSLTDNATGRRGGEPNSGFLVSLVSVLHSTIASSCPCCATSPMAWLTHTTDTARRCNPRMRSWPRICRRKARSSPDSSVREWHSRVCCQVEWLPAALGGTVGATVIERCTNQNRESQIIRARLGNRTLCTHI
jgi:hypothetical protein